MKILKATVKFLPVVLLAGLMISGQDALIAAPLSVIVAVIVANLTEKLTFKDCLDASIKSVSNIIVALFILMFAYAMASAFMKTGVGASVVNIALSLGVTARTTAVTGLMVTAVLSVATGTSWGTFAACSPIFLWLVHIVDPNCIESGSLLLTTCAIAGGACFGDNIGLISDTTIVSSGIQRGSGYRPCSLTGRMVCDVSHAGCNYNFYRRHCHGTADRESGSLWRHGLRTAECTGLPGAGTARGH